MPTIARIGGYRFFFFSNEGTEPPHVHVEHADQYAKFWLGPIKLAKSAGFNASELTKLRELIGENEERFREKWNEYFSR